MDISRSGEGYREVREWLSKVMILRLRKVLPRHSHSFITTQSSTKRIWWDSCVAPPTLPDHMTDQTQSGMLLHLPPMRSDRSVKQIQLHGFHKSIFEKMREILCQVFQAVTMSHEIQIRAFWIAIKSHFDDLCNTMCQTEEMQILLYYYRVSFSHLLSNYLVLCESSAWGSSFCS